MQVLQYLDVSGRNQMKKYAALFYLRSIVWAKTLAGSSTLISAASEDILFILIILCDVILYHFYFMVCYIITKWKSG